MLEWKASMHADYFLCTLDNVLLRIADWMDLLRVMTWLNALDWVCDTSCCAACMQAGITDHGNIVSTQTAFPRADKRPNLFSPRVHPQRPYAATQAYNNFIMRSTADAEEGW